MREGNLVRLDVGLQKMRDPFEFIEQRAKGKRVLNVGAGGGVHGYLPSNKDVWLHERLRRLADELVGVDIDEGCIEHAAQHGYEILNENCETMALEKEFDLIVMSDVIEHVNAPVAAIDNLLAHLADDGLFIITTPNATSGNVCLRSLLRKNVNVLADHVTTFYPEHIQAICDRIGCRLESIYLFDHIDRRNRMMRFKSALFQAMTSISLRLASSMLVVIRK